MPRHTMIRWMALSAAMVGQSALLFALTRPATEYTATLVGKDGRVLKRYAPNDTPESLRKDIERALAA